MNTARILGITAWLAAAAWSQPSADALLDPVNGSTAADLVRLALERNGELLAGESEVAVARGDLQQAGLRANPMLDINGMKALRGPMNSFMVGASLPLELYHRRDRRVDVAAREVDVSVAAQRDRERQLREAVESKFGGVLAALRDLQFTNDLLALNREALRLTAARADQGAIPTLDADLLRVEVNRIDALRIDLEAELGIAALELKSLVGLQPDETIRIRGALDSDAALIPQDEAISRALATRPDLAAARAMETAAAARLRQAETQGKLDASVSAAYERSDFSLHQLQEVFHQATLGVSITLPTRDRNQGAVAAATAEMDAARRRREYAELIARREIAAAYLALQKAQQGLAIYREGVLGQSQQNLAVIRRVYELGRNQLLDVIAEQRRLIDVEMGYTDALNRAFQAVVRLRAAANVE